MDIKNSSGYGSSMDLLLREHLEDGGRAKINLSLMVKEKAPVAAGKKYLPGSFFPAEEKALL